MRMNMAENCNQKGLICTEFSTRNETNIDTVNSENSDFFIITRTQVLAGLKGC